MAVLDFTRYTLIVTEKTLYNFYFSKGWVMRGRWRGRSWETNGIKKESSCVRGKPEKTSVKRTWIKRFVPLYETVTYQVQALVVQNVDNVIRWINLYPLNSAISFSNIYPLDSAIQRLNNPGQEIRWNVFASLL